MTTKKWVFLDRTVDEAQVAAYCELFGITPLIARVMLNRGLNDAAEAKRFLDKDLRDFHSPMLLRDMDRAVVRIRRAIAEGENITVYGDYDVDGITSTAMMVKFLRSEGAHCTPYIPDRQDEGYGLNCAAIDKIAAAGTNLMITVDTGITALDEAEYAKIKGIDLIITDHHECKEALPAATAVVNPKRSDCDYPFKDLAGVGVAFKVICAVSKLPLQTLLARYVDLVALGTIADVVTMLDENRVIASLGLEKLKNNPNCGLAAVIAGIGSSPKWNSSAVVSYSIAPRINAAGRMSNAMVAVDLLLTDDAAEAAELAQSLNEENRRRQEQEGIIFEEAVQMLNSGGYADKDVLVLAHRNWHHGIIGVVASRLCDKYHKSCVLISIDDDSCKSSGRSVDGVNLFDALNSCSDILEKFGGHAYAAGFSILESHIAELDARLNEYVAKSMAHDHVPTVTIDVCASVDDFTLKAVQTTEVLGPYGAGNPMPIVALLDVRLIDMKELSAGKHARLLVQKDGKTIEAIAFGAGNLTREFRVGDRLDLAGEMNINIYNGQAHVQLILKNSRLSRADESLILPSRDDFVALYRFLKSSEGDLHEDIYALRSAAERATGRTFSSEKLFFALEVFSDVAILQYKKLGDRLDIVLLPTQRGAKVELDKCDAYRRLRRELSE